MHRPTRLLASALFAISMSVFGPRVGFGGDPEGEINQCGGPAGTPSLCRIQVLGVEKRSNCDAPNEEWFVIVKNTSFGEHFKVRIYDKVRASWPEPPLEDARCIEDNSDEDGVYELAPGQCAYEGNPFYNDNTQPCDDPCCINDPTPRDRDCNNCTKILELKVELIQWKPNAGSPWQSVDPRNPPTVCAIGNSSGGVVPTCQVINICSLPYNQRDFTIPRESYCSQMGQ